MRYQPPSGIGDPNAPYVDFNPVSGEAGSIPPARAIEAPQREIVHVITATGQTPNEDDNTQLYQSIVAMIERVAQIPAGALMPFAGSTVPTGWLACNGASVRKADYPALYEAIRDTYN